MIDVVDDTAKQAFSRFERFALLREDATPGDGNMYGNDITRSGSTCR